LDILIQVINPYILTSIFHSSKYPGGMMRFSWGMMEKQREKGVRFSDRRREGGFSERSGDQ
jgi:hypothetical protein